MPNSSGSASRPSNGCCARSPQPSAAGDLVAHCGPSAAGHFLDTLCAVDLATGWTERAAIAGKSRGRQSDQTCRAEELDLGPSPSSPSDRWWKRPTLSPSNGVSIRRRVRFPDEPLRPLALSRTMSPFPPCVPSPNASTAERYLPLLVQGALMSRRRWITRPRTVRDAARCAPPMLPSDPLRSTRRQMPMPRAAALRRRRPAEH